MIGRSRVAWLARIVPGLILVWFTQDSEFVDFAPYFGPQRVWYRVQQRKLAAYDIDVRVLQGSDVRFEESENLTLTIRDGALVTAMPELSPDRKYVYAKLKLRKTYGWHIHDCAVRVRRGALRDAVLWICVTKAGPASIRAAHQACFELPSGVTVPIGKLDCEVLRFVGK